MEIILSGTLPEAIRVDCFADGEGLRTTLFTMGCSKRCPSCQNKQTWNLKNGKAYSIEEVVNYLEPILNRHHCDGLTVSGGDPLEQPEAMTLLLKQLKEKIPSLNIWCYTGYTLEELPTKTPLKWIDVLVDGPFIQEQRYPLKAFRGSRNQRLIRLKDGEPYSID